METASWAFYSPRAAGCGFAPHAEAPGWSTGVPCSKCSAPAPRVPLGPSLRDALPVPWPLVELSQLLGSCCSPGCCSRGVGLVSPPSASPQPERAQSCPFCAPILARAAPALLELGRAQAQG